MICILVLLVAVPIFYTGSLATNTRSELGDASLSKHCGPGVSSSWRDWVYRWRNLDADRLITAGQVSLFHFSPVKLPVGDECIPRDGVALGFATFERLTVWLLVPLLVANLAGLLHRKAQSTGEARGGGDE
jgi:hypothetical protein